MKHNYVITEDETGKRLDVLLSDKADLSRSFIQKLILDGHITINDTRTKPSYKVRLGDRAIIEYPEPDIENMPKSENIPINIVFEDNELIVVDKPAGMVVHPGAGVSSGTLVNAIISRLLPDDEIDADDEGSDRPELISISPQRPGIVHRIDKGTSGLLVVAKTLESYYSLADQFREHSVNRKYIALICGVPKQDSGTIIAPIGRSHRDRKKMAVTPVNSHEAITHFRIIEYYQDFSLAEVTLETGRTHQIRVHFAHIGHPVVGDPDYGGQARASKIKTSPIISKVIMGLSRQALHAKLLGFIHPATEEYMEFESPIPDDIQNVIDALNSTEFLERN